MKLTITKDCEFRGRSFAAGQTVLMSGQGAIDLLNQGLATCDDGRCGDCADGSDCQTASMNPTTERATKKRTKKKKPAGDDS
tara:strand:- start:120 stop:365 length:246 start_codon:yes stop_codon:yes gene_type:complete